MRLSEDGCKNLGYHEAIGLSIGSYDFQQEDFTGAIVLTVEEAKVIEELALLCLFLRPKSVTIEKAKVMKELSNRIEQAEVKE